MNNNIFTINEDGTAEYPKIKVYRSKSKGNNQGTWWTYYNYISFDAQGLCLLNPINILLEKEIIRFYTNNIASQHHGATDINMYVKDYPILQQKVASEIYWLRANDIEAYKFYAMYTEYTTIELNQQWIPLDVNPMEQIYKAKKII